MMQFVDDASTIEIINLLLIGLASFNAKLQVPSDISVEENFIPNENLTTQANLDKISKWTENREMRLNSEKTKCMNVNSL